MSTINGSPVTGSSSYTTKAVVKSQMPDTAWGTTYDMLLDLLIERSSRLIDGLFHREPGAFGVTSETTRYFDGSASRKLYIGELASVPSIVAVAESGETDNANSTGGVYTTWSVDDFTCWPDNWSHEKRPILRLDIDQLNGSKSQWYRFPRSVKITGYYGFATFANLPSEIAQAVEIQTVRWFKRAQQAFSDVGAITDLNQLRYVKKLDPDIVTILDIGRFSWVP